MTILEQKYYETVPTALNKIVGQLERLGQEREYTASLPFWDERHKGIFIPLIGKYLDPKELNPVEDFHEESEKATRMNNQELPTEKEILVIAFFRDEINVLLREHGGTPLGDKGYWLKRGNQTDSAYAEIADHLSIVDSENGLERHFARTLRTI